jgi:hypothetical protein
MAYYAIADSAPHRKAVVQWMAAVHERRLGRVFGSGIIGARRTNSADLHRPWRAIKIKYLQEATV